MWVNASVTMYTVQNRVLGVMAVIGVIAFILFLSQFYGTDRQSSIKFWHKSKLSGGLVIEGAKLEAQNKEVAYKTDVKSPQYFSNNIYAIVFDAGSTGSRVHIFNFTTTKDGELRLEKEIFEQVKPGLSSYSKDPYQAARSLVNLLKICMDKVPKNLYASTPLVLKATAGLRLLPEGQADNILNEVLVLLREYPFQLPKDSVGIMDGIDEGVFSWMTVNFMLGKLVIGQTPVTALDLGGGSTQITFVPKEQRTIQSAPSEFLKNVSLFKNQYRLYTHSYLYLGLMSVRFTMTGGDENADKDPSTFDLSGPCIHTGYIGDYEYGGKKYKLRGAAEGQFSYGLCESQIKPFVTSKVKPIPELASQIIYIFSYFFDRAVEANLIPSNGGSTKVIAYKNAALKAFGNPDPKFPFAALDLTYMYNLLHFGYELPDMTEVHLQKKINDVEVSWGLGAAFQLMSEVGLAR